MKKLQERSYFFIYILISFTIPASNASNGKKSLEEIREDNGESSDDPNNESLDIPSESENNNQTIIGVTCARKMNTQMHEIRQAQDKQFPFVVAIMSHQDDYLCSGSIVGNGLILTSAQCSLKSISYVLLNTTKARKDDKSIVLPIIKSEKFPTYSGSIEKDVALIYSEKHNSSVASKIKVSNATDASQLTDMEALGYGLNTDVGQVKELQVIGIEHRAEDNIPGHHGYFDCVETKVPTCFKDFGGPLIFDNDLVGVIAKGTDECTKEMFATYSVNKKIVDYVPSQTFKTWLDERIRKNEEREKKTIALATYPLEPEHMPKVITSSASKHLQTTSILVIFVLIHIFLTVF